MGDTIMATPLFNTLRATFPKAEIDLVLNERIANLFKGHPSIDNIYTFNETERHNIIKYTRKVWHIVKAKKYDVIIDMRSTINTQLFALLSPSSTYRIAVSKPYTKLFSNHLIPLKAKNRVDFNIDMALPLASEAPIKKNTNITLAVSEKEKAATYKKMEAAGFNFSLPAIMMNVTAKLENKVWPEDRMVDIIDRFIAEHHDCQIVFNYAPGREEENSRRIYRKLKNNKNVLIDLSAQSPRELFAMLQHFNFFFGNEGGARHIAHAAKVPSFVICSPGASKDIWIPRDEVPAEGVSADDITDTTGMTDSQKYDIITTDIVWNRLKNFIKDRNIL